MSLEQHKVIGPKVNAEQLIHREEKLLNALGLQMGQLKAKW